jgi:hypothetical protein
MLKLEEELTEIELKQEATKDRLEAIDMNIKIADEALGS